ncbi:lipoprotein [Pectobacterium carotovorum subsp. carotovorum]|nr:lipoprotein [Pectobacterium carotovorum subsp. carotovorum]
MKKLFIAALVILPLTACTTYGNKSLKDESQQTVKTKIVKGKTTQQDVINAFGEPQTRATNDGQEMWSYSSMSGESQISNYIPGLALLKNSSTAHMNSLEIWFKGNVVDRYNFSQTASKVSKGLLD